MPSRLLVAAIACFALSMLIFIFADGFRRLYSGIFFLVLSGVLLVTAWRNTNRASN